jgi:hypothetical protein
MKVQKPSGATTHSLREYVFAAIAHRVCVIGKGTQRLQKGKSIVLNQAAMSLAKEMGGEYGDHGIGMRPVLKTLEEGFRAHFSRSCIEPTAWVSGQLPSGSLVFVKSDKNARD